MQRKNTKKSKILFITSNQGKLAEIKAITGMEIVAKNLSIPEIQALDVVEVAKAKAYSAFLATKKPVAVDDTGLCIKALGGLPGAFITWFLSTLKPKGILKLIKNEKNRQASVTTCIAYADKTGVYAFSGTIEGSISTSVRGKNGFGYDSIFIPDGYKKTFAEMDKEEKNKISMRGIALKKFKKFLEK